MPCHEHTVVQIERRLIGLAEEHAISCIKGNNIFLPSHFCCILGYLHLIKVWWESHVVFNVMYYEIVVPCGLRCGNPLEDRILCFDFHVVLQ